MSIATEISRLQSDSTAIASAIAAKGVTVPSGSGYDDYATLISQISGGGISGVIPVDYIQTDGTAYIDTGIKGNSTKSAEIKITPVLSSSTCVYLGAQQSTSVRFLLFKQWGSNGQSYANYLAYSYASSNAAGLTIANSLNNATPFSARIKLASGSQTFSLKQQNTSTTSTSSTTSGTVTTGLNICLFACNYGGGDIDSKCPSGTKIHYVRIYSDSDYLNLVFDGIPCYYNGEYGMWDTVSKTFFGNAASSGAFTGPSVQ